ncbi:heat-shock protein [Moritella marina]|uniref:heat-shock protein n=1 Tax=Moritella marina TaxID=90736 RepID=UPI00370409AD
MANKRLFNLADHEVQQWKSFYIDETEFDFSHLNACKHTFQHPERNESYTLFFTFSHHVFTRGLKEEENLDLLSIYPYPSDQRAFDVTRFELSKHLPQIVELLPEKFCYHGGYSRYCSCKITQDDGTEIVYQVVYRVWKERGKMRFHIESAYPLQERLGRVKKVNFWVICYNLLHGKKLPQPAK